MRTIECDKSIVTCDVGTAQCDNGTIKCEKKTKVPPNKKKSMIKCDVVTT